MYYDTDILCSGGCYKRIVIEFLASKMELIWLMFLGSLAITAFGLSCSILSFTGEGPTSNWCPHSSGGATAILFLGASTIIPSVLLWNDESNTKRTKLNGFFYQFRYCVLALFWLKAQGNLWTLFGYVGIEAAAILLLSTTSLTSVLPTSKLFIAMSNCIFSILGLSAAVKSQVLFFWISWFVLSLLGNLTKSDEEEPISLVLEFLAPIFGAVIVSAAPSVDFTLILLIIFEILSVPLTYESFGDYSGNGVTRITTLAMPSHRAAVVVGAVALVSTLLVALNPAIVSSYLYQQADNDGTKLGLVFAFARTAEICGPIGFNRIHKETGSLLKTGLIGFWLSVLAVIPAIAVYGFVGFKNGPKDESETILSTFNPKAILLALSCVVWRFVYGGLVSVEHKIVSEWSSLSTDPITEQKAISSVAVIVTAITNIGIASTLQDTVSISVATVFGMLCTLLGALCYTIWFAQNDRGAWRLVDDEGRELFRVSG